MESDPKQLQGKDEEMSVPKMASDPNLKKRSQAYKNMGKNLEEMRKRRNEATVELRKNKREESLKKRRNISMTESTDDDDDTKLDSVNLERLVMEAGSSNPEIQMSAVMTARKLLSSEPHPPIDEFIESGILPLLVQCLEKSDNPKLQFESAWALTTLASGSNEQTKALVDAGAVSPLLNLLGSDHLYVCEQAVWALGNIICNDPYLRQYVISLGVIPLILAFIKPDTPISFLRAVTWVIRNLYRYKDPPLSNKTIADILLALNVLIHHSDLNILIDTVWAVSYLADGGNEQIQMVIDTGLVPSLIPLFVYKDVKVQTTALRAVGNIVSGTDEQRQIVLDCDALSYFPDLLTHTEETICKEAVWFLSKITAGSQLQAQAVINAGLLPKIIHNLNKGEFETKSEAAWAIRNLIKSGGRDCLMKLIQEGVIPPFCALLDCNDNDIIEMVLYSLYHMLVLASPQVEVVVNAIEECGGLDKIEPLKNHENLHIYKMAYHIIRKYFFKDEEE